MFIYKDSQCAENLNINNKRLSTWYEQEKNIEQLSFFPTGKHFSEIKWSNALRRLQTLICRCCRAALGKVTRSVRILLLPKDVRQFGALTIKLLC